MVLPNVWDAGSAVMMADAGAKALATTSGGIAWSLGRGDGQRLERDDLIQAVHRIASAVDVPVTADIESGYGARPEDVGEAVEAVVAAGAIGINLEDSDPATGSLFGLDEQAARIGAARAAAERAGLADLVINARTDVFLFQIGPEAGRATDVLARASTYEKAGADGIFVPGLLDLGVLAGIVAGTRLPLNVMAGPGAPSILEFGEVGVRRVSLGTAVAQASYSLAHAATVELLKSGRYGPLEGALDFGRINALFVAAP